MQYSLYYRMFLALCILILFSFLAQSFQAVIYALHLHHGFASVALKPTIHLCSSQAGIPSPFSLSSEVPLSKTAQSQMVSHLQLELPLDLLKRYRSY